MKLGRVVSTVVSTIQHEDLDGRRLLLCDLLDAKGRETGKELIAVDTVDAGAGETVLILDEGNSARQILGEDQAPIRSVIAGVVDLKASLLMLLFWLVLAPVVLLADDPPAQSDVRSAAVDRIFAEYDTSTTPGCVVGVYQNGATLYERGYGMANLEYGVPLGPDTVFRTASTSKQFTAMVIALLDQRGELSLDDPLSKYFPEFPEYAATITLRHMLHHTSGLRDYLTLARLGGLGRHYTNEEVLDLLGRQQELNFAPGEDYLYSNSGYFLLSQIVERLPDGRTLGERAEELIFEPLGMKHTHYQSDPRRLVTNRADGHDVQDDGTFKLHNTTLEMIGDGGIFSTVRDLRRWNDNFVQNRLGGGADLLKTLSTPGVLNNGEKIDYALGLWHDAFRGQGVLGHSGAYNGFRTSFVRFPAQDLGVALLCNRNHIGVYSLSFEVAEIYLTDLSLEEDAAESEPTAAAESEPQDAETLPPHQRFAALTGTYYSDELNAYYRLLVRDGDLVAVVPRYGEFPLAPEAPGAFSHERLGTLRFARPTLGKPPGPPAAPSFQLDAGRVRNLRFHRPSCSSD